MTSEVDLGPVREEVERYGPHPFLVTVTPEGSPHTVSVRVDWDADALTVKPGDRTRAGVADHPAVTLLWPAPEPGGYALIVDGTAHGSDGDRLTIDIDSAVLHLTDSAAPTTAPTCIRLYS